MFWINHIKLNPIHIYWVLLLNSVNTDEAHSFFSGHLHKKWECTVYFEDRDREQWLLPCEPVARFPERRPEPCAEVGSEWFIQNKRVFLPGQELEQSHVIGEFRTCWETGLGIEETDMIGNWKGSWGQLWRFRSLWWLLIRDRGVTWFDL